MDKHPLSQPTLRSVANWISWLFLGVTVCLGALFSVYLCDDLTEPFKCMQDVHLNFCLFCHEFCLLCAMLGVMSSPSSEGTQHFAKGGGS